jgi:lipopolysaccharide exporter
MKWFSAMFLAPVSEMLARNDRFSRGVIAILSGTVLSRVIAFAAIPVLSRMFTPSDFGVFALLSMVIAVLGPLATWRYEAAIILPDDEADAINVLLVSCIVTTVSSVLIFVVFFAFSQQFSNFLGSPELAPWLPWSALCIWSVGLFTALRIWKSRMDDFASVSYARVADTSALSVVQVGLGWALNGSLFGLLIGPFVGRFVGLLSILYSTLRADGSRIIAALDMSKAVMLAKRYARFPQFDLPASTLNNFSREMPIAVLGVFFIPQWVGLYSVANRVMSVPLQIVGGAIAQVYLPLAQSAQQSSRLDHFTLAIFDRLLRVSVTPMLLVAIAAPDMLGFILGDQWYYAGTFLRWICPWLMLAFIASPISEVFSVLERQADKLIFNSVLFITRLLSLVIGGILGDAFLAVALFGISGAIFWFAQCYWLIKISGVNMSLFWKHIFMELLRATPYLVIMGGIQSYHFDQFKVFFGMLILLLLFVSLNWRELLSSGRAVHMVARSASGAAPAAKA